MDLGTLRIIGLGSWPTAVGTAYFAVFDGYYYFDEYCSSPVNGVEPDFTGVASLIRTGDLRIMIL